MEITTDLLLPDVKIITPFIFEDHRGTYTETYHEKDYTDALNVKFVQDDYSYSRKNTLRGLHGDDKTWKLVQCMLGEIFLVVVDLRPESPTYKKHSSFNITFTNKQQVLVPPRFGNGHLCLSDRCIFAYKQSEYYTGKDNQFTVRWNDPELDIWWPVDSPILSKRDQFVKSLS